MLAFAEGEVTKLRREFKLVVDNEAAARLCTLLSEELGGCMPPPTRIVSVYFDKPGYPLTERAVHTPEDCLKVRTKEYSPDLGAGGVQRVVLEVKRERHGVTQKRRVWVPRSQLRSMIGGAGGLLPLIAGGRLLPVLGVTYRRHVYQASRAWRVTVDRDIRFHRVSQELALSETTLTAERLGAPLYEDPHVVIEVKHLGEELPAWLAALHPGSKRPAYSKFAEGMARVHSLVVDGVLGG